MALPPPQKEGGGDSPLPFPALTWVSPLHDFRGWDSSTQRLPTLFIEWLITTRVWVKGLWWHSTAVLLSLQLWSEMEDSHYLCSQLTQAGACAFMTEVLCALVYLFSRLSCSVGNKPDLRILNIIFCFSRSYSWSFLNQIAYQNNWGHFNNKIPQAIIQEFLIYVAWRKASGICTFWGKLFVKV